MYKILGSRPFTLLEVLIAFLLIAVAVIPLLAPYPAMFKQQKQFIQELEVDRLANILFVDLLAKIHKNEIEPLEGGRGLVEAQVPLPFDVSYAFEENALKLIFKPKKIFGKDYIFTYYLGTHEKK